MSKHTPAMRVKITSKAVTVTIGTNAIVVIAGALTALSQLIPNPH